ncbi:unnamed protein product [Protopolystoma xenopodis]|uniref:Uncharacterized protein n=1 Tax=Protopolystoma xenopodis TaxID=117903 RepID=A0A448X5H0_9PLAT|nr:unnamed protein product [Protopolystoma xenopodis]
MDRSPYSVQVIRPGWRTRTDDGCVQSKCNIVLVNGPIGPMIINPGSAWDSSLLSSALKMAGIVNPEQDIKYVVCTDGRAEFVGCISLFQGAEMIIVGHDIQKRGDIFLDHDFYSMIPFELDEFVGLLPLDNFYLSIGYIYELDF